MQDYQGLITVLITVSLIAFGIIYPGLKWKHDVEKHLHQTGEDKDR
jgi:hypothetical protein